MFSSNNSVVLPLIIRSLNYFDLIFVSGMRVAFQLHALACENSVVPVPFAEKTILSPLNELSIPIKYQLATDI